ncbi:hypothetical protein OSCI_3280004 [Kamptonema sp. PCC 6506]|nr:hypothetical protein OSCI_3280004 [Kamptonema sp. PCC 6506]
MTGIGLSKKLGLSENRRSIVPERAVLYTQKYLVAIAVVALVLIPEAIDCWNALILFPSS